MLESRNVCLSDGTEVPLTRLGSGANATAWQNGNSVFLQVQKCDLSREILASIVPMGSNKHLPLILPLSVNDADSRWYKLPRYESMLASAQAWEQFQFLRALYNEHCFPRCVSEFDKRFADQMQSEGIQSFGSDAAAPYRHTFARELNAMFIKHCEHTNLPVELVEAVRLVCNAASKFDDYFIDLPNKVDNCACDAAGNLILLDPLARVSKELEMAFCTHHSLLTR